MKKKLSEITISEGRRNIDYVKVSELAESIKIIGLLNPITVNKNNTLIAGAHRYEACKLLGFDEIECVVLDCNELQAELAEIDENLMRCELHFTERGDYLKRRKAIYEELHPETKAGVAGGKARQNSASEIISFAGDTANKIGISKRTVEQEIQISENLTPEAKAVVREKELPKKEALALARKSAEVQNAFSKKLITGEVKNFADYKLQEAKHHEEIEMKQTASYNIGLAKFLPVFFDKFEEKGYWIEVF